MIRHSQRRLTQRRLTLWRPLALAAALVAVGAQTQHAQAQDGVADPVISWGLSGLTDWGPAQPFLDLGHLMRPFFAFAPDEWSSMEMSELAAGGYLDADGYPTSLPPGMAGYRTVWAWGEGSGTQGRPGTYVLTHDGYGTITVGGSAKVVSSARGRIIFENPTGGMFWMDVTATDPARKGDYIRNISVLRADHIALAEAGAMFDPAWLDIIKDARELRYMDWMETNNSKVVSWSDRPEPGDATWASLGAPVEVMVRLANETGTDPWFNMPHMADDDYIRQFATYVRDNLDPRLKAHVEYSNENWNASFGQFKWIYDQAIAEWGTGIAEDWGAVFNYHGKRATEVALIWEQVFGAQSKARLVNVMGRRSSTCG